MDWEVLVGVKASVNTEVFRFSRQRGELSLTAIFLSRVQKKIGKAVSWILSWAIIHLGRLLLARLKRI